MKFLNIVCLTLIYISLAAQTQITIQPGAKVQQTGGNFITIDTKVDNSGDFQSSGGTFQMTGVAATNQSQIGGIGNTSIHRFLVDKFNNDVQLIGDVTVTQQLVMNIGNLDLNGHDITLSSGSLIVGERETARVYGSAGGEIVMTSNLNAPSAIEPGNIGATITSTANLGNTTIRRGHLGQNIDSDMGIERYYNISPSSANSNLDVTLRLEYFDAELNGHDETKLALWESEDTGATWAVQGKTTQDVAANYIELQEVESLARWTFSPAASLSAKVFLQGAYDAGTGLMRDELRTNGLMPNDEPYTAMGFTIENINTSLKGNPLASTGNDAIVDWVLVELRSTASTITTARAALLQRDGDVVDVDGVSPIFFSGINSGSYYIAVRHRNHLGTMSSTAVSFD